VHHVDAPAARLLDLTGDGFDELLVESDWGGAGTRVNELHVFDLRRGHFDEVLAGYSSIDSSDEEGFSQKLDVPRTRQSHGQQFCFEKSLRFENGVTFSKPKLSRPCYKRGDGVDIKESAVRNELLKPITYESARCQRPGLAGFKPNWRRRRQCFPAAGDTLPPHGSKGASKPPLVRYIASDQAFPFLFPGLSSRIAARSCQGRLSPPSG